MSIHKNFGIGIILFFMIVASMGSANALTPQEQLGQAIFTDTGLSTPVGQSCQSCHDPNFAFSEPDQARSVSEGAVLGRFGNRNAPSIVYSALTPDFGGGIAAGVFSGGMFWDGRAPNMTEQAKGPFTNPLEMNNANPTEVLNKINSSSYAKLFNTICGTSTDQFTCAADAIVAFEKTLPAFTSKFDLDPTGLNAQEMRGLSLFTGKANCVVCHPEPTFFTDFDYENIGVPSNLGMMGNGPDLQAYFPFYYETTFNPAGLNFIDIGLAKNPKVPSGQLSLVRGKFKAPTLRNVNKTAPYMHNGVFRDLKEVVHFYNTRDVLGNCINNPSPNPGVNCWPASEVPSNVNQIIGNLGMTDSDENDLVTFLNTLTDGYVPPSPPGITDKETLGQKLFTDTSLSTPVGQSCQSCHDPGFAFSEPDQTKGVSEGATTGRFGNRNAPSISYVSNTPDLGFRGAEFVGGQFWDGRAPNLIEQAKGPFINKLEMNNTDPSEVLTKVQNSPYSALFDSVCGSSADQYTCLADAIASFEKGGPKFGFNKFNSKFDLNSNLTGLTSQEQRGLLLFNGKGQCFACHPGPYFFTDFDYANIGVPSNLGMIGDSAKLQSYFPFYYDTSFNPDGLNFVDIGLAGNPNVPSVQKPIVRGMQKAPTLRNVASTGPYMHNGVFNNLKQVVHFYNTRDKLGKCANNFAPNPGVNCWPSPEVPQNLNFVIGNLGLTDAEENDIVSFLNTLTDDYVPSAIQPTLQQTLGQKVFTDTSLSSPAGQSCQGCHDPNLAFTDADKNIGVSAGAVSGLFGNRNAPSVVHAGIIPDFGFQPNLNAFSGGLFWDGRASTLTEQAKGPFTNPLEMNNPDSATVLNKIRNSPYAATFDSVCSLTIDKFNCVADAIAAFERTPQLNSFNSRFDKQNNNLSGLTTQEKRGFAIFSGKANCFVCHKPPYFFTDYDYENIGVPSNLGMLGDSPPLQSYFPFYYKPLFPTFNLAGLNFVDIGLAGNPNVPLVQQGVSRGLQKAPTLRNIELTAPYMHNGVFRDLKQVVHFYNTRDVLGNCASGNKALPQPGVNCWPSPEVSANLNFLIGNLGLTESEENDLVAFLKSLTEREIVTGPFSISGMVTLNGLPLQGASMTLSGTSSNTMTTDKAGKYSFTGLVKGTYIVSPAGLNINFNSKKVTIKTTSITGVDFKK